MANKANQTTRATKIALSTLFGVAVGNAIGLLIGISFTPDNLGIGILIGNAVGIIGGLVLGIIFASKNKDLESK